MKINFTQSLLENRRGGTFPNSFSEARIKLLVRADKRKKKGKENKIKLQTNLSAMYKNEYAPQLSGISQAHKTFSPFENQTM